MKKIYKKWAWNIFSVLAVAVFGFILLNLAFLFDALYQGIVRGIVGFFISLGPESRLYWFPPLMHLSFLVLIGIISWIVLRSRLWTLLKAIYLCVPVVAVLVTLGMFLYGLPFVLYPLGALFCFGILYYLYRTKKPWIYYFTVIFLSIVMAIFTLSGGEI